MFGLCDCSEDDTISLFKWYLFGDQGRFLLAQEPVFAIFIVSKKHSCYYAWVLFNHNQYGYLCKSILPCYEKIFQAKYRKYSLFV